MTLNKLIPALTAAFFIFASPANLYAESKLDDALGGFEDEAVEDETPESATISKETEKKKPSPMELSGSVALKTSYNYAHEAPQAGRTDYRGLSRLRTEVNLQVDLKLSEGWKSVVQGVGFYDFAYSVNGRGDYTDEVLDSNESEAELQEVYARGSLTPNIDLKLGRQIVVWGKSDNLRVTDVLNPLDTREPGMVDIEDLRLPVTMMRGDYYIGKWSVSAIIIPEIRFNKEPAYGSDFYPAPISPPPEEKPDIAVEAVENMEYAVAFNGVFSGFDLSFYAARIYNDSFHLERRSMFSFVRRHAKLTMLGAAGNVASGNWLFISEAAWIDGLEFYSLPGETRSRLDFLLGAEYSGITDTSIALDAVNRRIFGHEQSLENLPDQTKEDELQWAARLTRNFLNQTLKVTALASVFGADGGDGSFQRYQASYDVNDWLNVTGGVMVYQPGEKLFFKAVKDNDRIFLDVKYSF